MTNTLVFYFSAMYGPPPGVDPQVYSWFRSVDQDQSGKITAKELQQALFSADWKHFNNETIRLMISKYYNQWAK